MDDLATRIATNAIDETRLLALARDLHLCDGGVDDKDPPHSQNWATNWKVKTMCVLLHQLYEPAKRPNPRKSRSSYGLKHDLERLFQTYAPELSSVHTNWVGNGELILAMAYCGFVPYKTSAPNTYYYLTDLREGKDNKSGDKKIRADFSEEIVRLILRKKVEEHLSASS
jgi:hypothetical protein